MNLKQLEYDLKIQNNNIKILQECLESNNNSIQKNDSFDDTQSITELLAEVKNNLDNSRNNINYIESIKNNLLTIENNTISEDEIDNYYKKLTESLDMFNAFLVKYIKNTSYAVNYNVHNHNINHVNESDSNIKQSNSKHNTFTLDSVNPNIFFNNTNETKLNNSFIDKMKEFDQKNADNSGDNKVLLISEKQNKIFLPYTMRELIEILSTSTRYKNVQDLIDKKYTLPLDKYKNGVISRFREAYNFMKRKERASIADSLDLALDLAFNYKLNPAIIVACKNLEELDTYLDCLELGELDKFEYFEIKYEMLPTKKIKK